MNFFLRIKRANLTINLQKCEFCKAQISYLGFLVGDGKVLPLNPKIEAIKNIPIPHTKKQVRQFLGVVGYYRRFCPMFSEITSPLTELLSKNAKFNWNEKCQVAFEKIKEILSSHPVLIAPDFSKSFTIAVDACDIGVGGVLMQEKEGTNQPIAFFSKKRNKYQRKFSTIEKGCLGLILCLRHFEFMSILLHLKL